MNRGVKRLLFLFLMIAAALLSVSFWAVRHYDVSFRFLLGQSLEHAGIQHAVFDSLLRPPHRYEDIAQDGVIRQDHPRILLPGLAQWDGAGISPLISERLALYQSTGERVADYPVCKRIHVMSHVMCWLTTGDPSEARRAVNLLLRRELTPPDVKKSGNNDWEWALAFDLLAKFPGMDAYEQAAIAAKLRAQLVAYLIILDDDSASLWHGRSSFAAQAWLLAVTLSGQDDADELLARRAQAHFLQTIGALALTEAWPEGYNYWINNRALVIALAASAWVNGLEASELAPSVVQALRRAGLWAVYATRPDNRIEALGDEGPRVDLKDETRRAIDVIAQLTGDSVFATYSSYLQKLHRQESYFRDYRWSFVLFNDPAVSRLPGIPAGELTGLEAYLPRVELFGPNALNLLIVRSGWGPDDTFISMRAGHVFTHHGNYAAGHFTLFKGRPLAVDSARYNGFFSPHRLYYGLRTVAKNSILVIRPGDTNRPDEKFVKSVNDGGQRLVIPTGSRIRDVEHWRAQLGARDHYEGGELQEYDEQEDNYAYVRVDLAAAYDSLRYDSEGKGGKVSSVQRELLYLFKEDRLLVRDIVTATDPDFNKKWLLHTINRPLVENSRLVLGEKNAGVFESEAESAVVLNTPGRLDVERILPEDATLRVVGGAGFEFLVEADPGDDGRRRKGENFAEGGNARMWFDNAAWRLEFQPGQPRARDEFLVALSPSLGTDRSEEVTALNFLVEPGAGLATPYHLVVYTNRGKLGEVSVALDGNQRSLLVVGVLAGDKYQLELEGKSEYYEVTRSGVLEIALPKTDWHGETLILRQHRNSN